MAARFTVLTGFIVSGALALTLTMGGCAVPDGSRQASPSESGRLLPPPALPDLSGTDPFAAEQIRSQHASLTATVEASGLGPAALAEAYGDMGKLLMAAALPEAAGPYLEQAHALAPRDVRWSYYLGHLYRNAGALPESIAAFEDVLRLKPDDAVTLVTLADVYLAQGRPDDAEALYRKQLTLQPDSVVANVGIGRAELARNEYAKAVEHLEEAFRLSGETAVGVHYPLAVAYRGLGDVDKAEEHMAKRSDIAILPEDPLMEELEELLESPRASEARGNRALSEGDWPTAARHFRRGLTMDPNDPVLRHRLGTALFQMKDPRGAAEQFEQIIRTSPDFVLAHFSLGLLLEGVGLRQEAIERFETALQYEPDYIEARLGLAALLRRQGRLQESLAQYDRVMEEGVPGDPRIEEAPFGRAVTLVRLRRYAEARDLLTEGIADYPGQPFFVHALARLLSGAPEASVRDGSRALALVEGLPDAQRLIDLGETMAMALAEVGRFTEAVRLQQNAIDTAIRGGRQDLVPRMQAKLTRYEGNLPWRSDDPVEFDPFLERSAGVVR